MGLSGVNSLGQTLFSCVNFECGAKWISREDETCRCEHASTTDQSKTVTMAKNTLKNGDTKEKSLESWLWDAACAIRGQKDAPKFKDYILPLVFVKRLCDVFDDEVDRVAERLKTRARALQLIDRDHSLVRFYLPLRAKKAT